MKLLEKSNGLYMRRMAKEINKAIAQSGCYWHNLGWSHAVAHSVALREGKKRMYLIIKRPTGPRSEEAKTFEDVTKEVFTDGYGREIVASRQV